MAIPRAEFSSNKFSSRLLFYTLELLKRVGKFNGIADPIPRIASAMRFAQFGLIDKNFLFYNVLELHERVRGKVVAGEKGKFIPKHVALSEFQKVCFFLLFSLPIFNESLTVI